jgi:hypothetical protein
MKTYLILMLLVIFSFSLLAQEKTWRSSKKNEISIHFFSMWNKNFLSYGIGYERNILHYKNNLNSYLTWQNAFFVRTDNFLENFPNFSSSTNQIQSFIKYNLGYKKILGLGLGAVIEGKRFYFNPTGLISCKYDIPKIKLTIGLQYQVSYYRSIPLSKLNGLPLPGSLVRTNNSPFNIIQNWCGGISLGRYF